MDSGDYAEAIETATDLLTVEAGRDDILNILGQAQFAVGHLDAAGSSFERAYALKGDGRLRAMGNLGALARYRGETAIATDWFERVVAHYAANANLDSSRACRCRRRHRRPRRQTIGFLSRRGTRVRRGGPRR